MLTAAMLLFAQAAAPAYPRDVAGWLVVERPGACAMGSSFAGPGDTYVLMRKTVDGRLILAITNEGWSAREGQPYRVSYQVNGKEYADGTTIGYREGDGRGFWSSLGRNFEQDMAAGSELSVFLDGRFIRKVSLTGTKAAIAELNRCISGLRGKARPVTPGEEGEAPLDPFSQRSRKP